MSNSVLKHFTLISLDEVMRLPHQRRVFVLCFDCDGILVKITYSRYPRQQIVALFKQAAPCREIWLFNGESHFFEAMCRYVRDRFEAQHVRAGYMNIPMSQIDAAVDEFLSGRDKTVREAVRQAA